MTIMMSKKHKKFSRTIVKIAISNKKKSKVIIDQIWKTTFFFYGVKTFKEGESNTKRKETTCLDKNFRKKTTIILLKWDWLNLTSPYLG